MTFAAQEIAQASALVADILRRDVSDLPANDLVDAHAQLARLGRLSDALLARFAGEIARRSTPDLPGGGLARRQGFGNASEMVAKVTGGSQADARRAIDAGLALVPEPATAVESDAVAPGSPPAPRYPAIAEAVLSGQLSVDAAAMLTAGLESVTDRLPSETLHSLERKLVEKARSLSLRDLRRAIAFAIARADLRGHEERERRQYEDRFVTWTVDHTGTVTLSGRLDPVTAAPIRTVIEQMVTQQMRARRDQDPQEADRRTVGQMRADALFELARHALGCTGAEASGVRTTIVVRMRKAELESGVGLGRVDGVEAPVSVRELRRLAGDAGILPAVLAGDSEVLDLGRTVRFFTKAQRLALLERDGGCAKCHAPPEHCEAHHIRWWENGGPSDLSNGIMLCTRCHHDIHRQGWEILIEGNRTSFIPPPQLDPGRTPLPGGVAAVEVEGVGGEPDYASEDFFDDDEVAVRAWIREAQAALARL